MKRIILIAISCIIVCAVSLLTGCDNSDPVAKKDEVLKKLTAKTWSVKTVSIDDVDKSSSFAGLTLTITDGGFTTTNGKIVWPASGTWTFTDDAATAFKRDDQVIVTIDEVTETQLTLRFSWAKSTYASGRANSTSGTHVFKFN